MPSNNITWLKSKIKAPPLNANEERELFKLIAQGSRAARNRLVEANLKFVIQVSREYSNCSLTEDDLIEEGTLGLMRAIETFDNSRGVKFITYAVWWIKAYITRAMQNKGDLVRIPANRYSELHGKQKAISLSKEIVEDSTITLCDTIPDKTEPSLDKSIDRHNLDKFLGKFARKLSKREQDIIGTLYGTQRRKRKTVVEISKNLGISRERIRQIRDSGLQRIAKLNSDGHYTNQIKEFCAIAD